MKSSPPFTAFICILFLTALVLGSLSCSNQPASFRLAVKYEPVGKMIEYKLESHRVGSAFKNGELHEDFDVNVEVELVYTTQKILPNGDFMILEENVWSWDEPTDDSGKVKRITRDYAYKYQITPQGKMVELDILAEQSQVKEDYVKSYTVQGWPVFPDQKISVGYEWTQTASVDLPNGEATEVSTAYTVKGTALKQGYNCAIIEYKGNMALPLFKDPDDEKSSSGVDRIEMNGILYFAIDAGMAIHSEERRRVVSDRTSAKEEEPVEWRSEFEAFISYSLVSMGAG